MDLNIIVNADCLEYMRRIQDESIDVVITSPPYANQRESSYGGVSESEYQKWMISIANQIYRILKQSGSFVLNIKEHVNDGRRSTYVLRTVLALSEILMWNDTFIWNKPNPYPTGSKKRLKDGFEYCYLFTKTADYKFNPDRVLIRSTSEYLESELRRSNKGEHNVTNGSGMNMSHRYADEFVRPSNVITMPPDNTNHRHPATFPIGLPDFFIRLLTDENDIVFDPFAGSGTSLVAAKRLRRNYIGCEINQEYIEIINDRIDACIVQKSLV